MVVEILGNYPQDPLGAHQVEGPQVERQFLLLDLLVDHQDHRE